MKKKMLKNSDAREKDATPTKNVYCPSHSALKHISYQTTTYEI